MSAGVTGEQRGLLAAARRHDETAYQRLVEPHRKDLHAHCYRMLASVHDADDALQEALLRAWRALPDFEGRSSVHSWLYRIATNTCLDLIARRQRRILPADHAGPADPARGPGEPLLESVWVEPYADERLGIEDGFAAPEARYERRESVELAFIAALQHLSANQRAVLLLRDVLGYSAQETAQVLETTTGSVTSALQRARITVDERIPGPTQKTTLRLLGDVAVRELVRRYVDAWERCDIDAIVALLTEDATFAMPPLATWFRGSDDVATFFAGWPFSGNFQWRTRPVRANGQPAHVFYCWDPEQQAYVPFALNVLTLRGDRISDITSFITRATDDPDPEVLSRLVDQPFEPRWFDAAFLRFGLPDRLD